jgi:hypothetical protein
MERTNLKDYILKELFTYIFEDIWYVRLHNMFSLRYDLKEIGLLFHLLGRDGFYFCQQSISQFIHLFS